MKQMGAHRVIFSFRIGFIIYVDISRLYKGASSMKDRPPVMLLLASTLHDAPDLTFENIGKSYSMYVSYLDGGCAGLQSTGGHFDVLDCYSVHLSSVCQELSFLSRSEYHGLHVGVHASVIIVCVDVDDQVRERNHVTMATQGNDFSWSRDSYTSN